MRIIFVRHGHPNYKDDCLTELGHVHAKAAAGRLKDEGICEIHASSCGRAYETAQYTAEALGLGITVHDFMRELSWGSADGSELPFHGHPWDTAEDMAARGESLLHADWRKREPFLRNTVVADGDRVAAAFDALLATKGYVREGGLYRATDESADRTIAMFSHAGSSGAVLAHMLNLPFPLVCQILRPDFTAITVVRLDGEPGALLPARLEIANDSRHIRGGAQIISR